MTSRCPICHTDQPLDAEGFLGEHNRSGALDVLTFSARCVGSGQTPGQLVLPVEPAPDEG